MGRPTTRKADQSTLRKDVEWTVKDADEQIAAGIVMVPDAVDLQQDFVRESTIRQFAGGFQSLYDTGQADGGVMHAAWPSQWLTLERNEVLDASEEIGGEEVAPGAWVQEWRVNDDELWGLIADGILEGYSIGAVDVSWDGPHDQGDVDDVTIPDEIGDDAAIYELVDGIIREVSAVDIPAVPDAEILDTKADADKRLADHLGNRDAFIEEAMDRGHSETDAERLWTQLNRAIDQEGAGEPGKQSSSLVERVGSAVLNALGGGLDQRDTTPPAKDADADGVGDDAAQTDATQSNATEGDTSDSTMSSDNDNDTTMEDAPTWARTLHNDIQENSKRIDDVLDQSTDADAGDGDGDAKDAGGDGSNGGDGDGTKADGESVEDLKAQVKELEQRLDSITRQSGVGGSGSDQLEATGEESPDKGLDGLSEVLG
jgi:hypothetical protein